MVQEPEGSSPHTQQLATGPCPILIERIKNIYEKCGNGILVKKSDRA
jgi:hypothetical protein